MRRSFLSAAVAIIAIVPVASAQSVCEREFDVLAQVIDTDKCLSQELFFPKIRHGASEEPPKEAVMSFTPLDRQVGGVTKCQVKPSLRTFSPASDMFASITSSFPNSVEGIDVQNPHITSVRFVEPNGAGGFSAARIEGRVTFEKRIKYKYPCFRGIKIYSCSGWTRLFRYTPGWSLTVRPNGIPFQTGNAEDTNYSKVGLPDGKLDFRLVGNPQTVSPHRDLTAAFMIDVPKGSTGFDVNVSNDLVKAVQFLANVVRANLKLIGAPLELALDGKISSFRAWDLENQASEHGNNADYQKQINFIRDISRDRIGNFTEPHTSTQGQDESIALSAILDGFEGTSLDFRTSMSSPNTSGQYVSMTYEIDSAKLLDRIYEESGTYDPLTPLNFCEATKDNLVDELRQVLEEHDKSVEVTNPDDTEELEAAGMELFRKGGMEFALESYLESKGTSSASIVSRQDVLQFLEDTPVARNYSNLSEMAEYFELTEDEHKCAISKVRGMTGSADLIYPGHNISDCLANEVEISEAKQKAVAEIDQVLDESGYWESFATASTTPVPPIANAQYRGWYYCYRQRTLCGTTARNVIRWQPDMSQFNARPGGRHNGIDVFDSKHAGGDSSLVAVARAQVFYRNVKGWGHTIFLPFKIGGDSFYAVYAHLDSGARNLDGKIFSQGQKLFSTGCTGNAGDGKGNCNNYCKVGDAFRTDEHLHFEILHRNASPVNKPVDPTKIIPAWKPKSVPLLDMSGAGNKVCSECKDQNCVQQFVER